MKDALGPNVKVSLPQAFQSAKKQSHKVLVKGVSTDIKQEQFENMLTQNNITFAKAERFISKRSGTPLTMFLAELKEAATAEALIAKNLVCQKCDMIFKVEEFRALPSIRQYYHCQGVGHSAQNCRKQPVCLISGEGHSHQECTKTQPKCKNCKGPHVSSYKGCLYYRVRPSDGM